jgi:hypothetical protein
MAARITKVRIETPIAQRRTNRALVSIFEENHGAKHPRAPSAGTTIREESGGHAVVMKLPHRKKTIQKKSR